MSDVTLEVLQNPAPVLQVLPENRPVLVVLPQKTAKLVVTCPAPVTVIDVSPDQTLQITPDPAVVLEVNPPAPPILQFVAGGLRPGGTNVAVSADDLAPGTLEQKIVAGTNITLATLNPGANEQLEITATVPPQVKRQDFKLNLKGAVPNGGIAYLFNGQVSTSSVPLVMSAAGNLAHLTVKVDVADTTNDYDLEVEINGVTDPARTLALTATNDEAQGAITGAVALSDDIALRWNRAAGSGKSDFKEATVILIITES